MPEQPPVPPAPLSPSGSAAAPRRTGLLAAALAIGLVLGAAGVGVAWAVTGGDTAETSKPGPAADARGACNALAGFDESEYTAKKANERWVAHHRWSGAFDLSAAAAREDREYKPLSDALAQAQKRHSSVFKFDAEVKKYLAEARRICTDIR